MRVPRSMTITLVLGARRLFALAVSERFMPVCRSLRR